MVANTKIAFPLNWAVESINHNPQPRAQANLSSSTGDSNDDSVLVNKIINGVNSLLTARKENVEQMTTLGSGTQSQLSQDSLFWLSRYGKRLAWLSTAIGFGSCKLKHFMDISNICWY